MHRTLSLLKSVNRQWTSFRCRLRDMQGTTHTYVDQLVMPPCRALEVLTSIAILMPATDKLRDRRGCVAGYGKRSIGSLTTVV